MCGRYELHSQPAAIALAFGLAWPPELSPRYNIAPMQDVPVIRIHGEGRRELVQMRWGLVPRFAKNPAIGARMINARAESVATRPVLRNAFRRHRCLFPANAFYEWRGGPGGSRLPMRIGLAEHGLFAMAGLFERWLDPHGEPLDTCTILTTQANALVAPVHERMPLILDPAQYAAWLDPDAQDPVQLLRPFPPERMQAWPVSTRVNNVRNDDAGLIEPVELSLQDETNAPRSVARGENAADTDNTPAPAQAELF